MIKVITYGTFDLLHYGHIRLLERAKALGDYLIVGVTADDFDKSRGKINIQQSLMERMEAVRATGLADEIIVEEYEGQKIDDVRRYDVDIFTVGSDWVGKFDYLKSYCDVVYLERTEGISSSKLRSEKRLISLGLSGDAPFVGKVKNECRFVNGIEVQAMYTEHSDSLPSVFEDISFITPHYEQLLSKVDAVYVHSHPAKHYEQIKNALLCGKHVLCESPIALSKVQCSELFSLARDKKLILMEALKTAYSTAYSRLLLMVKTGKIGSLVSVDATCTSLEDLSGVVAEDFDNRWNTLCVWGPTALLPIFQLLGVNYRQKHMVSHFVDKKRNYDTFTKIDFRYDNAVASLKVGKGVKSEGELIISGTQGYIYVPAPWWKTDYFEIRYEDPANNKRFFYQLDGEGIRYELVAFVRAIERGKTAPYIEETVSCAISGIMEDFFAGKDVDEII